MGHAVFHAVAGALVVLLGASWPSRARAQESDAFARVIVSETELRSGPGVSHRVIYRAQRGETLLVETRETKGFWLEVVLPDGRVAYVLGDTVDVIAVDEGMEGPSKPGFFAPPALTDARGGFALLAGIYDLDGYAEFRPSLVFAPSIAFEPYIGIALEPDGRRLLYGGAVTLNFAPDWAIAPFFSLGVGGLYESPKEEFILEDKKWFHARAGGGLLISLRLRVLVRLEASNVVIFQEDDYENTQSYVAGLGTYF